MTAHNLLSDGGDLAIAAYADLLNSVSTSAQLQKLVDVGMTQTQAEQFSERWPTVVDQYIDSVTDLVVTVFANGSEANFAIRGTNLFDWSFGDLWADIQLVHGLIPSQYAALKEYYESIKLNPSISTASRLTISGHSLGGFLAQLLAVNYKEDFSATYTYNAPGIGGIPFDIFGMPDNIPLPTADITNVRGDGFTATATLGTSIGAVEEVQIENSLLTLADHSIKKLTDSLLVFDILLQLDSTLTVDKYNDLFKASSNEEGATLEKITDSIFALLGIGSTALPVGDSYRELLYQSIFGIQSSVTFQALLAGDTTIQVGADFTGARTNFGEFLSLFNLSPLIIRPNDASAEIALSYGNSTLYADWLDDKTLRNAERTYTDQYLQDRALMLQYYLVGNTADTINPSASESLMLYDAGNNISITTLNTGPTQVYAARYRFGDDTNNSTDLYGGGGDDHLYGMGGNDTIIGAAGDDYIEGGMGGDTLIGNTGNDTLYGGADDDTFLFTTADGFDKIIDTDHTGDVIKINNIDISGYDFKPVSANSNNLYTLELAGIPVYDASAYFDGASLLLAIGSGTNSNKIHINHFLTGDFGIDLESAEIITAPEIMPGDSHHNVVVVDVNPRGVDPADYTSASFVARAAFTAQQHLNDNPIVLNAESVIWADNTAYSDNPHPFYSELFGSVFEGGQANDQLTGGDLIDYYLGFGGDDYIDLKDGMDHATGGQGSDTLLGGDGSDLLYGFYNPWDLREDGGMDRVMSNVPTEQTATFYELAEDKDTLIGGAGDDLLMAGSYDDFLDGGTGDDLLFGGKGSDVLAGGSEDDYIHGDTQRSYDNVQVVSTLEFVDDAENGFAYNDTIDGGEGNDYIAGEIGDDIIYGGNGFNEIYGDRTNDPAMSPYSGLTLSDYVALAPTAHGNDFISGGNDRDFIYGNGGDDIIEGGAGDDLIYGDDDFLAENYHGNDTLYGEAGVDAIHAGAGDDVIYGGSDVDFIYGERGNDLLFGDSGNDFLDGGEGDDTLIGGADSDLLEGGPGNDTYLFSAGFGNDEIVDDLGSNVIFFNGVADKNILVMYQGNDVYITNTITGDQLKVSAAHLAGMELYLSMSGNITPVHSFDRVYLASDGTVLASVDGASGDAPDPEYPDVIEPIKVSIDSTNHNRIVIYTAGPVNSVDIDYFEGSGGFTVSARGSSGGKLNGSVRVRDAVVLDRSTYMFGFASERPIRYTYYGTRFSDTMQGTDGNDSMHGYAGVDTILGMDGDDYLLGDEGGDTLRGFSGIDTLNGGVGNDLIETGYGPDLLEFSLGDGQDQVTGFNGDTIEFDSTVKAQDVYLEYFGVGAGDWRFRYSAQDYFTSSQDWFGSYGGYSLDNLIVNGAEIDLIIRSSLESGFLYDTGGDDVLVGGAGNDTFYLGGNPGYSEFITSNAINGEDRLLFSEGDGLDTIIIDAGFYYRSAKRGTIVFDESVAIDSVTYTFGETSTWINYGTSGDVIEIRQGGGTVKNSFDNVELIFESVSNVPLVLTIADDSQSTLYGSAGDDIITGSVDNNYINTGSGNDIVHAGDGDDVIDINGNDRSGITPLTGHHTVIGGFGNDEIITEVYRGQKFVYNIGDGDDVVNYNIEKGRIIAADYNRFTYIEEPNGDGGTDVAEPDSYTPAGEDIIEFGSGITLSNLILTRVVGKLIISFDSFPGSISIPDFFFAYDKDTSAEPEEEWVYHEFPGLRFDDPYSNTLLPKVPISYFVFDDGFVFDLNKDLDSVLIDSGITVIGTDDDDYLKGDRADAWGDPDATINDVIYGGAGNDEITDYSGSNSLFGEEGDDTLRGGVDEDVLIGGSGNDTYEFLDPGFGTDIIDSQGRDISDIDTIFFSNDIDHSSVSVNQINNDLLLSTGTDTISIKDFFIRDTIDQVEFQNGPIWNKSDLIALIPYVVDSNGNIVRHINADGSSSYSVFNNNNQEIFSIDSTGIVYEVRYDTQGRITDRITYQTNIAEYLTAWIVENPTEVAPSASDISGFFAQFHQDSGQAFQQLLANGNANYVIDNDQWFGDAWVQAEQDNDLRFQGVIAVADGGLETPALRQIINLQGFNTAVIDSADGALELTLGGSHKSPSNVQSSWLVMFYDGDPGVDGELVGTPAPFLSAANANWDNQDVSISVPVGSRYAEVLLSARVAIPTVGARVPVATDTPVYFDNVYLEAHFAGDTGTISLEPTISEHTLFNYYVSTIADHELVVDAASLASSNFESLNIIDVDSAVNGAAVYDDINKQIRFTPEDDFIGEGSFTYLLDDAGTQRSVTVSVLIEQSLYIGEAGIDIFEESPAADIVYGNGGNDILSGGDKDDSLFGGADNDTLMGGNGSDWLDGGVGADSLVGGAGDDCYIYNAGDGTDTIDNFSDDALVALDELRFGNSIAPSAARLSRGDSLGLGANDLIIDFPTLINTDRITVENFFVSGDESVLDQVVFDVDNTVWNEAEIRSRVGWVGSEGRNILVDTAADEVLYGLGGNDVLLASNGGNDSLYGGAGKDFVAVGGTGVHMLDGGADNDLLVAASSAQSLLLGGDGDDSLVSSNLVGNIMIGGEGSDQYYVAAGSGANLIVNNSSSWGVDTDTLSLFGAEHNDIWFTKAGDDLLLEFVGKDGSVTVSDWFDAGQSTYNDTSILDRFVSGDGKWLASTEVEFNQLINAMAAFGDKSGIVGADGVVPTDDQSLHINLVAAIDSSWKPVVWSY